MRRPITHKVVKPVKISPTPNAVLNKKDVLAAENVIMKQNNELIVEENKILNREDVMPFVLKNEEEIINYIKDKATKETLKSLAPLLEKLEEAVNQQKAYQQTVDTGNISNVPMSSEEQLKKLQEVSKNRVYEKELKITERINKLQLRFSKIRKG